MKRFLIFISLAALMLMAAPAMAITIVDFTGFLNPIDITTQHYPEGTFTGIATPDGLTFAYDDPDNDGVDFAEISGTGVFGTAPHTLSLDFTPTAYGAARALTVDFALLGVLDTAEVNGVVPFGLFAQFSNGDFAFADPVFILGNAFGTLMYQGPAFDKASSELSSRCAVF